MNESKSLCECGHFDTDHDASGECRAWVGETETTIYTCGCRGFITPADRRWQSLPPNPPASDVC